MIVMKFGGTSVGTLLSINQVAAVVAVAMPSQPIVVTSAMSAVTDELLALAKVALTFKKEEWLPRIAALRARHEQTILKGEASGLETKKQIDTIFFELEQALDVIALGHELTPRSVDFVASCGERLAAPILANRLQVRGIKTVTVDSRDGIITDDGYISAEVDFAVTNARLRAILWPIIESAAVPVITGFIAKNKDGVTTTLGRGGSDYTAAIVGAALLAEEIQIWTDVDGMMSADPRIVPGAKILSEVTYAEAVEMSYFGAKVIHPKTMQPAFAAGIPIIIKNTFCPQAPGTKIKKEITEGSSGVKVITSIPKVSMLTVQGLGLRGRSGFAAKVFAVAGEKGANIIMITQASSEQSICLLVDRSEGAELQTALLRAFSQELDLKNVESVILDEDVSIVAAVGAGMKGAPGIAAKTFSAAAAAGVNILAIAQGSSEMNISFVVRESEVEKTIRAIHAAFLL